MRLLLTASALLLCLGAIPAKALDGPWCLRGERGAGSMVDDCQYASYVACRHFLYLYGSTSSCIPNINFRPSVAYEPRKRRKFQ